MEDFDRRKFGALAFGAAALTATPALAQRRRRRPVMMTGMTPVSTLTAGDWMMQVKAQHKEIDRHFMMLKRTGDMQGALRDQHLKQLATVLTGHSIAEEVALYPGLVMIGDRGASDRLYKEQQDAKVMVAQIDAMPRQGPEFLSQLANLEAAIKAHVAEEEGDAYPRLMRQATPAMNMKMTEGFRREFTRYVA